MGRVELTSGRLIKKSKRRCHNPRKAQQQQIINIRTWRLFSELKGEQQSGWVELIGRLISGGNARYG